MADLKLNVQLHTKYWQRCLKTLLPTQYTSTDSSRMSLGFFILSALDLLGVGADTLLEKEQNEIRDWVLKCQHPNGGFCGSPNHKYPDSYYVDVGDGNEVKRIQCLRWLRTLQREDGSFGELLTSDGRIAGGKDMRYCFVALAVRWMLRGVEEDLPEDDINVESLVNYLRDAQTYDGGVSESSAHEAHAGYTYCAIASLDLLQRLPQDSHSPLPRRDGHIMEANKPPGLADPSATIRWLVSRQIEYIDEDNEDEDGDGDDPRQTPLQIQEDALAGIYRECTEPLSLEDLSLHGSPFVGFNASLKILGHADLVNFPPMRKFLLEQTQHQIGGFGKVPGAPPDIYHSYLGLAALATMDDPDLEAFDPTLCISRKQRVKIEKLRSNAVSRET